MQIEKIDLRHITLTEASEIGALLASIWPNPEKPAAVRTQQMIELGQGYTGPDEQAPLSFLIHEDGKLIAHSAHIPRTIQTATGEITVAGLTRVCTDPAQRGRGLGEKVVRATFAMVDAGTFPYSLFQTSPPVRAFYEKLGCCLVENPIVNSFAEDLHVSPFWDKVIMRYPSTGEWPEGEIDLRGPGY